VTWVGLQQRARRSAADIDIYPCTVDAVARSGKGGAGSAPTALLRHGVRRYISITVER